MEACLPLFSWCVSLSPGMWVRSTMTSSSVLVYFDDAHFSLWQDIPLLSLHYMPELLPNEGELHTDGQTVVAIEVKKKKAGILTDMPWGQYSSRISSCRKTGGNLKQNASRYFLTHTPASNLENQSWHLLCYSWPHLASRPWESPAARNEQQNKRNLISFRNAVEALQA